LDSNSGQLRLMAVHAHPDDESSKGAATMARYASEGVQVLVCTLTGGERGDILNPAMDRPEIKADMARVRREEMARARDILGVEHRFRCHLGDEDRARIWTAKKASLEAATEGRQSHAPGDRHQAPDAGVRELRARNRPARHRCAPVGPPPLPTLEPQGRPAKAPRLTEPPRSSAPTHCVATHQEYPPDRSISSVSARICTTSR